MNSVHILYDGYSYKEGNKMFANCTCTLIKGEKNILIDCMTAWDKDKIIEGLAKHGLEPSSIDYAIATHGHSDHLGNLNLFLEATHIVGFTISKNNEFFDHSFDKGEPYVITDDIKVVPTPGHTSDDISIYITIRDNERNQTKLCVVTGA
ncbi:Metallo-beta-lactamase domain-containing protein 1 [Armadillidium nasatum]|uniref:Metallo-beta-lactamase domain-containing protein 1 n=1 Tax=Armadillidium nasatum TaxID=96803 RepID=A0A5N5T901_9CRUS|nr:Metallo-beta-lactamase domain-containing protein 1 [Armadillidium nasatum]